MNEREPRDQDRRGLEGEEFMEETQEFRDPDPELESEEDPGIEPKIL